MRTAHYVASTHWDREWYESFQGFRYRLAKLLDEVFTHLEANPAFASFEMDGQTVPLLDYLEVRPESEERVRRLCAAGRFRIGPWFVLPEEWLVSGESLVRNLEMGFRQTAGFGSPRPLTAPLVDEFGHVSQMPQILAQFDVLGTSLHRGINLRDCQTNFRWGSPDGTAILTHRLPRHGYGSLQIACRGIIKPDEVVGFDDAVERMVAWTLEEARRTPDGPILALDACDHIEMNLEATAMIAAANDKLLAHGIRLVHSDSDSYVREASAGFRGANEASIRGELRETGRDSSEIDPTCVIQGVLSSRARLKQANAACEDELCRWAEPFSAFAFPAGQQRGLAGFFDRAWRYLLENHAHDSIGGCSADQVHQDMAYRFDQSLEIGRKITDDALRCIALASAPADLAAGALALTVFNPNAEDITGPTDLSIRLPTAWKEKYQEFFGYEEKFAFRLLGPDRQEIPWQLVSQRRDQPGYRRRLRKIAVEDTRHVLEITAAIHVPAFGYTTLTVEPTPGPTRFEGTQRTGEQSMENEFLRVDVTADGLVTLLDKIAGRSYAGLFSYEDRADIGDGWYWAPAVNDVLVTSAGSPWRFSLVADGREKTTFQVETRLRIPAAFDFKTMTRGAAETELIIRNRLTLRRGSRALESEIEVDNVASDHRMRVCFPTGLRAASYLSDSAFDAVERPIALVPDNAARRELDVDGRPQQTWTALSDGERGVALVSRGLYESGVGDRPDRPIFVTLFRGFRKTIFGTGSVGGQSLGKHSCKLHIVPFSGDVPVGRLFLHGQSAACPARVVDLAANDLAPRPGSSAPRSQSFFRVQGDVIVTSLRVLDTNEWEVRVFNPATKPATFTLGRPGQLSAAAARKLSGVPDASLPLTLDGGTAAGTLPAKRIATIRLALV